MQPQSKAEKPETKIRPATPLPWRVENLDRPGHYWLRDKRVWKSLLSGSYSTYSTRARAERAARGLSRIYRVRVEEDRHD